MFRYRVIYVTNNVTLAWKTPLESRQAAKLSKQKLIEIVHYLLGAKFM